MGAVSEALTLDSFDPDLSLEFTVCLERECPPLKTSEIDERGLEYN